MKIRWLLLLAIICIPGCVRHEKGIPNSAITNKPDWIYHVDSLIMPFWMTKDALGNPSGNFPVYRYPDGTPVNPSKLDSLKLPNEYQQYYMANSDSLRRDFIRVKSRQIYGYCVAYHITGNEEYLINAKNGLDYLIKKGVFSDKSVVSFWDKNKNPQPNILQRNTQDLAYGLLGPSIYYYLTRDPEILKIIIDVNRAVWKSYYEQSNLYENTKLFNWVAENFEGDSTHHKILIAPLDQLNAYTLLTAQIVPDSLSEELKTKVKILAKSIKNNFYSNEHNMFWSSLNNKTIGGNTDFAHSIKTFWMLYISAQLLNDQEMHEFAKKGAEKLLQTAYLPDENRWASNYLNAKHDLDKSIMTWHQAELDQMAATLSFSDTSFYSKYLIKTYPFFEKKLVDPINKGTFWGRTAKGEIIEVGFRSGWHMANFHDMEHALIGYLSSSNYYGDPTNLYFAFLNSISPDSTIIKPYYYQGTIKEISISPFNNYSLSELTKTRITFTDVH
ncbi:AGE family epimerase/isomerase [Marinigracilibium pacificum]|uniref:Uncharacterized protein n=1 Tax=Marinigracilibium pacificum TaxID=2729599 RepID=A0A848IWU6_9BACT|nr:hypothetical protein [Marinigracilibium pacificum]NMM47755.1 hypothetical protein [Marinigracilibium pacificum]